MNLIGIKSAAGCAPEVVDRWDERCLDAMHTNCRRWGLAASQMKGYRAALDEPGFVSYRDEDGNTGALVNLDANPDPAELAASLAGPVGEPDTGQLVSLLAEATAHEIDRKAGPVFYAVESCDGEDAQVCLTYTDPETAVTAEARRWNERGEEVETLFGQLREGTGIVSFGPLRGCRGILINPERDHREGTFTMAAGHLFDTEHPTHEAFSIEQLALMKHLEDNTLADYALLLEAHVFPFIGHFSLLELGPRRLQEWQIERIDAGAGPSSIGKTQIVLGLISKRLCCHTNTSTATRRPSSMRLATRKSLTAG